MKKRVMPVLAVLVILIAVIALAGVAQGWWVNSNYSEVESKEAIVVSQFSTPVQGYLRPGQTGEWVYGIHNDAVSDSQPVAYGMRYSVAVYSVCEAVAVPAPAPIPAPGGGSGGGSSPAVPADEVEVLVVTLDSSEGEWYITTEQGEVVYAPGELYPPTTGGGSSTWMPNFRASVTVDPDGNGPKPFALYKLGDIVNIESDHVVLVSFRPGAETCLGKWGIRLETERGEPKP